MAAGSQPNEMATIRINTVKLLREWDMVYDRWAELVND